MGIMVAAQPIKTAITAAAVSWCRKWRYQSGKASVNTICSVPQTKTRPAASMGRENSSGSSKANQPRTAGMMPNSKVGN